MTDTSMMPETPNVAETAHFLRRFADMMSVGHNANFLHHAAVWLETLSARLAAAQDEEQLWRYKYETIAEHTDALEAECEALKHDLDGHLNVVASTLSERDALRATLQAREAEVSELQGDLDREREEFAATSQSHQQALAELRAVFDRERETLTTAFDRERETLATAFDRSARRSRLRPSGTAKSSTSFAGNWRNSRRRMNWSCPSCVLALPANVTTSRPGSR